MIVAAVLLLMGVLAYGASGAQLHTGSRSETGALRSPQWWLGTALQGAGFFFTLFARRFLPLLLVQSCVTSALAVTALIQHVQGVRRMRRSDVAAIVCVVAGIAALGVSTVPGPAPRIAWRYVLVVLACAAICVAGLALPSGPVLNGLMAGFGFSFSAICARLLIGDHEHPLWIFWELPLVSWVAGSLVVAGMVLGQIHLTRGLARGDAAPVLGCNYGMATIFPALFGLVLLHEQPRPSAGPQMVLGVLCALGGALWLLRGQGVEPGSIASREGGPT